MREKCDAALVRRISKQAEAVLGILAVLAEILYFPWKTWVVTILKLRCSV